MQPVEGCRKPKFWKTETSEHLTHVKKDDLYYLIASLSPAEKKVFKEKYAAKGEANFIRLFDAVAAGEVKNDADAKKKFATENFVNHLGKAKAYLYEAILNSLHEQLQPHFARLRILQHIAYAETLYSRKLNVQAEDILLNALEESQQAEEFELEQFIIWQLAGVNSKLQQQTALNNALVSEEKINEYREYNKLFLAAHDVYLQRGKKDAPPLDDFGSHPLLNKKQTFKSKKAERTLEITKSLLNTVSRNYKDAHQSNLHIVELLQPMAKTSAQSEVAYINAVFNAALSKQGLEEDSAGLINLLEDFQPVGKWAASHRFVCLLRLKAGAYALGKRNGEGKKLMKLIEEELPLHKTELNEAELIKLHISVAGLYMKERDYNRSLDYLLLISHSKIAAENRPVIYRVAMLYQLIAHYELENFDWLGTTLRNYKYFQKANDSFYLIEKHTLDFLNKALRLSTKKERDEAKKIYERDLLHAAQSQLSGLAYLFNIDWVRKS